MSLSFVLLLLSALVAGYMALKCRGRSRNKATIGIWLGVGYSSIAFDMWNVHDLFIGGPFFIFFGTIIMMFDSLNPDNLTWKELRERGGSERR